MARSGSECQSAAIWLDVLEASGVEAMDAPQSYAFEWGCVGGPEAACSPLAGCYRSVNHVLPRSALFTFHLKRQSAKPPPPTTSGRFKNCFLYLGNGPVAMPWMLLLIYRGHRMKEPSGNVLIINLFHTLIKDSWQPLVFAAAVQQDAGELRLKRLPGI